jgi:hypothetical protein
VESLQGCCFDQCHLCGEGQKIDDVTTIYYNGKTIPCSESETIFNEQGVLASSECHVLQFCHLHEQGTVLR